MKLSDKNPYGTSFYRVTIRTTVHRLKEAIGEPQYECNTGEDKVNFYWTCETNDGRVFKIYDWKEYRVIDENEGIEFHIGAKDRLTSEIAGEELIYELNKF